MIESHAICSRILVNLLVKLTRILANLLAKPTENEPYGGHGEYTWERLVRLWSLGQPPKGGLSAGKVVYSAPVRGYRTPQVSDYETIEAITRLMRLL